jgi:DNA-binding beta-propeller fold protein YncE
MLSMICDPGARPRWRWRAFAPCLLLTALSCGSPGSARLDVVVKDVSMAVVRDASVTTEPETRTLATGEDGHARFGGLSSGTYTVKAEAPAVGTATATVSLGAGESRALTLILRRTDTPDGGADAGPDGSPPDGSVSDGSAPDADGGDAGATSPIVLQPLGKDSNGIDLRWTSTRTFASYRIYRGQEPGGGYSIIDVINDPSATAYRDEAVTLGVTYRYRVAGLPGDGSEISSNVQSLLAGVFIAVNSQVERMKVDPERPYLYAIDRVNNSLHFVNLTSQTVEKTIFIGSSPAGLDINQANTELYVANAGSTEIAVVDLATRVKSRSLLVDVGSTSTAANPARIAATTGDTLVFSGQDSFYSLRLVSAASGAALGTVSNSSSAVTLVASPDGTHVYSAGYYLYRFDIVGATIKQVDSTTDFASSSTTTLCRSGNGTYLFYGARKVLATNLKSSLGTFPENILVANSTGTRAVGAIRVYDGESFTVKAALPITATVTALSPDDKTLYLADTATSRIYLWKMP